MHEFKEYPRDYSGARSLHPFCLIIMFSYFLIRIFRFLNFNIIVSYFTNVTYFMINYTLIRAKKKKIQDYLRHHEMEMAKNKDESQSKTNTICKGCGVKLSISMFKNRNEEFIKPKIFFLSIKGYFCKKCYKKYSFLFIIDILLLFLFLMIPTNIITYLEYGVMMPVILFLPYIILAFSIALAVFILDYSKYFRLYNV